MEEYEGKHSPRIQNVLVLREEKSDSNALATKTTLEEKLNAKLSNITSLPKKK